MKTYQVYVTVYYHKNLRALRKAWKQSLNQKGWHDPHIDKTIGFSWFKKDYLTGEIHVVQPANKRQSADKERTLGHELRHIIEGDFHKHNVRKI